MQFNYILIKSALFMLRILQGKNTLKRTAYNVICLVSITKLPIRYNTILRKRDQQRRFQANKKIYYMNDWYCLLAFLSLSNKEVVLSVFARCRTHKPKFMCQGNCVPTLFVIGSTKSIDHSFSFER